MAITKKQKEVFDYIVGYSNKNGYAPTQREIKDHFGFKSFGSVQTYLKYLVNAGYLETDWNARRGITLSTNEQSPPSDVEEIPWLGDVAAGVPIEAIENPSETIQVPKSMLAKGGNYFALSVRGDSMIEAGILESDVIVCKHQSQANNGQIVIAVVDGEATLKTINKTKKGFELIPSNSSMQPFTVGPDQDFRIAGVLVGLLRSYV
tara:strand:+ start:22485 stop:23102 length:618 start_codon:yes stop_codon:yes gene_type:complete